MPITTESAADIPDPIISQGVLSITISAENVDEEYTNPVFTITPPLSTPNQGGAAAPKDTWIINLMRIEAQIVIRGYVDSADRGKLRTMFQTGDLHNNPCTLSWDGLTMPSDGTALKGIITKLVLHRPGTEEQSEWPVDITFTRGAVR